MERKPVDGAEYCRSDLMEVLPAIDRKAAGLVPVKPAVTKIWNDLREPLLLDETEQLWLMLNPDTTAAAGVARAIRKSRHRVWCHHKAHGRARHQTHITPSASSLNRWITSMTTGFTSIFALQVPIEEANQRLRDAVIGQEWSLGVGTIKIVERDALSIGQPGGSRIGPARIVAADPAPQGDTGL
ncbi:MAG: DUF4403 family protein [Nitrospira sp.]